MTDPHVAVGTPITEPPKWATVQRTLIAEINDAVDPVVDRYLNDDGSALWPSDDYVGMDALDDVYEGFYDWPLFYLLGGSERVLQHAREAFEAITEQFAEVPTGLGHPQVVDEYQQGHDWFHQGEGYVLFYTLAMADPDDDRIREVARRFADFYVENTCEDQDLYDDDHRLLRSPMNGSMGPAFHNFSRDVPPAMGGAHSEPRIPWAYEPWKEDYGLPFYDLDGIETIADLKDPTNAERMGEAIRDRCSRGDVPQNLGSTSLVTNAFLLTGEEKYREWVTDYVDAWAERAERNGGLLPDNVGLDGEIGQYLNGRWYGGWYGWTWPHGWHGMGAAVTVGVENAAHLAGDRSVLDLLRSQLDRLTEEGYEDDQRAHVPLQYADEGAFPAEHGQTVAEGEAAGWFNFQPLSGPDAQHPVHLWYLTQNEADARRLDRFRRPPATDGLASSSGKGRLSGHVYDWVAYLWGEYSDYPRDILSLNLDEVHQRREFVRTDDQDPSTYSDSYLHDRNPVLTEGLVNCTMGAPQGIYYGGLPLAHVRHFDPERGRPGLPPDVAVLVTDVTGDRTALTFVNLASEERTVTVQAGTFAHHRFTTVETDDETVTVDDSAARVTLAPESRSELRIGTERFVNEPTYAFPWE